MKTKALLFTQGEAGIWEPVPFELFKEDFFPFDFHLERFKARSEALQQETNDITMLIQGVNVFALAFSDGTVWDMNHNWREGFGDDWSKAMYNDLYKEKTCLSA